MQPTKARQRKPAPSASFSMFFRSLSGKSPKRRSRFDLRQEPPRFAVHQIPHAPRHLVAVIFGLHNDPQIIAQHLAPHLVHIHDQSLPQKRDRSRKPVRQRAFPRPRVPADGKKQGGNIAKGEGFFFFQDGPQCIKEPSLAFSSATERIGDTSFKQGFRYG